MMTKLFENGRYCNEVRETIMELLSLNVSTNKVNEVIHTVIQKLTKKSVGRLPSNAVKSRLLLEARHLAHVQVAEVMLDEGNDRLSCVDQLITSVKSTMSDKGPINPCFNKQLKTLREQLLPNVIDKWETFDEQLKNSLSDMCNFVCKMHLLPIMATEADKVLRIF